MMKPLLQPNEVQKQLIARKYGMFIHFGINTFNDIEWSDGKLDISTYNPTEIDADGWVKNAYLSGMNYVILITKHHDGFCLFNTKYTDYSVKNTANPTDVVQAVATACKKYGLKLGIYYSLWDRHEKCYKKHEEYVQFMLNQLEELLTNYGEVVELWLDGAWDKRNNKWGVDKIYALMNRLQPQCAMSVNSTIGKFNAKGYVKSKYFPENYEKGMPMRYFPSDFRLLDPRFPKTPDPKIYTHNNEEYYLPFEATICIRNMTNWFWDPKYTEDKLVDVDFIVNHYKQLTSQDNVLIVNVSPNIYGKQEVADFEHLMKVADTLNIARELKK